MGKFTAVSANAFNELQVDAGVILNKFNPSAPAAPADADIICATSGGINPQCIPQTSDWGEDMDNVPNNTRELLHIDGYDCKLGFTAIGVSAASIKMALGAVDVQGKAIIPRRDVKTSDFNDIWFVGDTSDGGAVAICLKNAYSTGGFALQTNKNGKGQLSCELTGFVSIDDAKAVPMEFYVLSAEDVGD